jgi:3-oxoacyl-[acyl-carrier-protein] synthase III
MGPGAAIAGVAMALPERLVSNDELADRLGVDPDWIAKRTGTRERPWAADDERLSQLAAQAGRAALEHAEIEPGELDLVLVATSTADEISPNAAPLVAGLRRVTGYCWRHSAAGSPGAGPWSSGRRPRPCRRPSPV